MAKTPQLPATTAKPLALNDPVWLNPVGLHPMWSEFIGIEGIYAGLESTLSRGIAVSDPTRAKVHFTINGKSRNLVWPIAQLLRQKP